MLEIRTYDGTIDDLVDFVNQVWSQAYANKMTFPYWNRAFFEWQFRSSVQADRRNLIAAYDGTQLAGVLLGTSYPFRSTNGLRGNSHCQGSQWSWLSIPDQFHGRGIAKMLDEERITRQRSNGSKLIVSFRYIGSRHSRAERPHRDSRDNKFNRKIGFWARVIDPSRFARWHWQALDGWLSQLAAPLMRIPAESSSDPQVRSFVESDLSQCVELCTAAHLPLALTIAWDHDSLRHQLCGSEVVQTLILEEQGAVTGFINFHLLPFHARTVEPVAIIDLIVINRASPAGRLKLLNSALSRMQNQGAVLALKLRSGDLPAWPLWRTHFIPKPADSLLVLQGIEQPIDVPKSAAIHVLWR